MKSFIIDYRKFAATIIWCLALSWKTSRLYTIIRITADIVMPLLAILAAFVGKHMLDLLSGAWVVTDTTFMLALLFSLLAAIALVRLLGKKATQYSQSMQDEMINAHISLDMMNRSLTADLEFFDNPEYYDRLKSATQDSMAVSYILWNVLSCISSLVAFAGAFAVLITANPLYGLVMMVAAVPASITAAKYTKLLYMLSLEQINEHRQMYYAQHLASDRAYAQDIRLYNAGDRLKARYRQIWDILFTRRRGMTRRRSVLSALLECLPEIVVVFIGVEDVAGQEEAKESLTEIVDFLHNPDKYVAIGAVQPKGALLVGPPGTGKTLLAKAVAGEANVVFFSLSGSDFVEMFVGVGASRVRDLFKQAAQHAPCIIFIDEIDAIGKSRDSQMSSNDEREQTLNQLLAEMDGFDSSKGVVILGATNRPEILDKALLRPGRFDRRINVELPDLRGRVDILKVHSKKVKMGASIDLSRIAAITPGAAGADLANMINEAALRAVRMGRHEVAQEDLMEAVEVVIAGKEKKDRVMSESEKRVVAFHEVGHALAAALQKDAKPVQKITIIPRTKGSLGYVLKAPEEEKFLTTKVEMLAEIVTSLAGRAAEELMCNTQTTGASNDIEQATRMARSMVSMYGMSEKFGLMALENVQNRYLDGRAVLQVSDATGAELDAEVKNILHDCYARAKELLQSNEDKMNKIADHLFTHETITGDEFMAMFNDSEATDNETTEE